MTNQPDEQTETDELNKILNEFRTNTDVNRDNYNMGGKDRFIEIRAESKAAIEAWSRQQTAQVLDKLLEQRTFYTRQDIDGVVWAVPVAAIAALRVGLNRATQNNPEEA